MGCSALHNARSFLIWREGKSVDWDCTVTDLSRITGIPRSSVRKIVHEHKWPVRIHDPIHPNLGGRLDVLALVRMADLSLNHQNIFLEPE